MTLDVLSERGYIVSFDSKLERVPERVDPKTFSIICTSSPKFYFNVRFPPAAIRKQQSPHLATHDPNDLFT